MGFETELMNDASKLTTGTLPAARLPSGVPLVTIGTYTGNISANRAIAHGLGVVPKLVLLQRTDAAYSWWRIHDTYAAIFFDAGATFAVTAPNATNFYVGNAANYDNSANGANDLIRWVAIG